MEMNCEDGACEVNGLQENTNVIAEEEEVSKDKLMYFGDPMCSWCYGIANHIDQMKDEFGDFDFELIMGGLRPGGGDEWTEDYRNMLKTHWSHVNEASGQPFDYSFFDREDFNYDTEPAARAVRVVRDIAPEKEWAYYKEVQKAFYAQNQDVTNVEALKNVCSELGIDTAQFEALFNSEGYKRLVYQDFIRSQQLGVRGFPCIVLKKGEEYYAVSQGYSTYENMKSTIGRILAS